MSRCNEIYILCFESFFIRCFQDYVSVFHLKHFLMYERVLCAAPLRPVNPRHCLNAAEKIVLRFWGGKNVF